MNQANTTLKAVRIASEVRPRLPLSSRNPMASAGRPGAAFGKSSGTYDVFTTFVFKKP